MVALPWSYKVYSCTLTDPLALAPAASFIFFGRPVRIPFQTQAQQSGGSGRPYQHLNKGSHVASTAPWQVLHYSFICCAMRI